MILKKVLSISIILLNLNGFLLNEIQLINDIRTCPAGYYCQTNPLTRTILPQACPPGTYSGVGSTGCTPCKVGHWTIHSASSFCELCPFGHHCANASSTPTPCPIGTFNPSLEQIQCSPCPSGHYTPQLGSSSCTPCPHGHFCGLAHQQPIKCPIGNISNTFPRF